MIYPVLQKNNLTGAPVKVNGVKICGDINALSLKVFKSYGINVSGDYNVTELVVKVGALGGFVVEDGLEFEPEL